MLARAVFKSTSLVGESEDEFVGFRLSKVGEGGGVASRVVLVASNKALGDARGETESGEASAVVSVLLGNVSVITS
jgi:hypothetical protein